MPPARVLPNQRVSPQFHALKAQRVRRGEMVHRRRVQRARGIVPQRLHFGRQAHGRHILHAAVGVDFVEEGVVDALHADGVKARVGNRAQADVLLRAHHGKLPAQAVHRPARARHPHLPAVAVALFLVRAQAVVDVLFRHLPAEPFRQDSAPAVHHQPRHLVQIAQGHAQPCAALASARGVAQPMLLVVCAKGREHPRGQVVHHLLPGQPRHQRRQHLRAARIVVEHRARFVGGCGGEERLRPVVVGFAVDGGAVARRHPQHIADFQAHQARIRLFGQIVAEVVGNAVIQRNFPFVQQKADGKRRHGFRHRVHPVRLPLLKRRIVRRRLHFAPHVEDEAVHTHTFALQAAHKILHAGCQTLVKHGVHSPRRHRLPECTRPSP